MPAAAVRELDLDGLIAGMRCLADVSESKEMRHQTRREMVERRESTTARNPGSMTRALPVLVNENGNPTTYLMSLNLPLPQKNRASALPSWVLARQWISRHGAMLALLLLLTR